MSGLTELEPGPLPVIPKTLWTQLQEWMLAWKHAEALREAGLQAPGALLLYGPTGSGKTSLARGLLPYMPGRPGLVMEAHNTLSQFFSGSATALAEGFRQAEYNGALLVIEEIDALGISRAGNMATSANEEGKITIALMRCLEAAKVPVIATTNYKDALDTALLRRFELQLEVPEAGPKQRAQILKKIMGVEPPEWLVEMRLVESIRIAHKMVRDAFLAKLEGKAKP